MICLAPSHPLLQSNVEVARIDFKIGKCNREDNKVSGKRKNKFKKNVFCG